MREPYCVTIDGVRYVPAREAVANLDDIRTAIEDVFWGEGYKTREQRDQYELWVQVYDDGEGTPLSEFMDELAAKLTRAPLSPNPD